MDKPIRNPLSVACPVSFPHTFRAILYRKEEEDLIRREEMHLTLGCWRLNSIKFHALLNRSSEGSVFCVGREIE